MIRVNLNISEEKAALRRMIADERTKIRTALERGAIDAVAQAKSLTSQMVGGYPGHPQPRQAHPGGWADRTSNLVNSMGHEMEMRRANEEAVSLVAKMEYAAELDEREGFSVFAGAETATLDFAEKVLGRDQ